jgi:parallel beta-helix repeat protein
LQSTGVITHGVEHTLVHGNIAEDCLYDGFKSSGYSRRNRIIGNTSRSNGRDGFDLYDGFIESVLADNLAEGNTLQGYEIKGLFDGADYVIRDSVFANNVAVNNGYPGFTINSVRNCTFSGNHSTGNAQEGYYLSTVQGCTFVGNFASRNVMDGYHLAASVSRTVFNGCYAADNSWVDGITQSGTYNGFRISAGCAAQFVGCGSINGTTAGKKGGQGYGWYWAAVSTGNQSVNCYALGNTLSGFGGVVGWAAENGLININDNGTFRGAQFSSDALNQIELSTANMSVIRTGANGEYTASRASGAAIVMSAQSSVGLFGTSSNHAARLATGGTARVEVTTAGYFQPVSDNVYRLGNSSNRWSEVYVAAGTINTSDERVKEQWASISAAERRTAIKAKALLKSFKFRDAVEEKGSGARIHFGIGAQSLKAAFESEGLVAEHYAVLCYDEWPEQAEILDEDGAVIEPYRPAGNRYGVRYDELLALIIAAL